MRTAAVSTVTFILFLLAFELLFRFVVYVDKGSREERYLVLPHDVLGWSLNTRMRSKHLRNRCGEPVAMSAAPHHLILKYPRTNGVKKIVFLGDSFTHAHEVSTGMAYYDVFEQLEAENYTVYAVAVGGYGNLQEYMALQDVFDEIQPDIVVWQLTGNDISNNVFELDDSSVRNNQRPRPYLDPEDGVIRMQNPGFWLFDWSESIAYLFEKLLILDSRYDLGLIRWLDSIGSMDEGFREKLYARGLAVLDNLIKRAVKTYPDTTFIGFSIGPKFDNEYEEIFTGNGALYLPAFYESLDAVEHTDCRPLDNHWNHAGNAVAGKILSERLRQILTSGSP